MTTPNGLPTTIEAVQDLLKNQVYITDRSLAMPIFLAIKLQRPLFLEGEAGVGKPEIARALAAGLEAKVCEIYTDVDGIYTADPRIVPEARILEEIEYEEMLELANYGAKMHPRRPAHRSARFV